MKQPLLSVLALNTLFLLQPLSIFAQCAESALTAPDAAAQDKMGQAVAISGNYMISGAPQDSSSTGSNIGSTYLFRWSGSSWIFQQKLVALDGSADDRFGSAVAIDGDIAVVGAPGDKDLGQNSGSAYVFKRNDQGTPTNLSDDIWEQKQKFIAYDGGSYDAFGTAVGVSGGTLIVGSYREGNLHDPMYLDSGPGAAYVFISSNGGVTWTAQQKLVASDRAAGSRFGWSVGISGDSVIIGSYLAQDSVLGTGAAYIFSRVGSTWSQRQKLQPSGPAPYTQFGTSVALHGDLAVVGDPFDDDQGANIGSISLFRFINNSWVREAELYASDVISNERFGASVSVHNDTVVAGAPKHTPFWVEAGAAYVFKKNGSSWNQESKLVASNQNAYHNFGTSVGISASLTVVGAPGAGSLYQAGVAYVYGGCATAPEISASSPQNGFIDALEDRERSNPNILFGIRNISITFSTPVSALGNTSLSPVNFTTRCVRNGGDTNVFDLQTGTKPTVTQVTSVGNNTYNLQLSSRLCLGAWTEITAIGIVNGAGTAILPNASKVVFGFLPMDITQDGKVSADDVNRWLGIKKGDVSLSQPLTPTLLLDQKRDAVIGSDDMSRGIELIDGIGTIRAWSGFDMGVRP